MKEHNTGAMYSSNPVYGVIRLSVRIAGELTDICIGDALQYDFGDGEESFGRVVGIMLSEELEGVALRVRRYMTAEKVTAKREEWVRPTGAEAGGLWETDWYHIIPIESIVDVVPVAVEAVESAVYLRGTVSMYGEWKWPYRRTLADHEGQWMSVNGVRTDIVRRLLSKVITGRPIINLPIVKWSDGFQTFSRGQVRISICVHGRKRF
jgi:hypothetical protein